MTMKCNVDQLQLVLLRQLGKVEDGGPGMVYFYPHMQITHLHSHFLVTAYRIQADGPRVHNHANIAKETVPNLSLPDGQDRVG